MGSFLNLKSEISNLKSESRLRGKRLAFFLILALGAVIYFVPPLEGGGAVCVIEVKEGKISANIVGAPIAEVVGKIAETTQAKVTHGALPNVTVTATFKDLPLEEGIGRILETFNYIFLYQADPKSGPPLKEVKLLFPKEKAAEKENEKKK